MKSLPEHIEYIRSKPHHVRRATAFGTAAVVTGTIALIWLGASLATGAFALKGGNFAEETGALPPENAPANAPQNSNVAGAAAALPPAKTGPANLQVVQGGDGIQPVRAPQTATQTEQTIIPF